MSENGERQTGRGGGSEKVEEATKSRVVLLSCPSKGAVGRASSVLNRNTKLYGPMNAIDGSDVSSCWNSEGNSKPGAATRVSYVINFQRLVEVQEVRFQFQGGFVGQECALYGGEDKWQDLEFDDSNELQVFDVSSDTAPRHCSSLKFDFQSSSDFYGRITVYRIEIWGQECEQET